jgi:hypothetical protein
MDQTDWLKVSHLFSPGLLRKEGDERIINRLIRLQRIYNFLCSMLVFTPFAYCFVTLRGTFMHFPELTY